MEIEKTGLLASIKRSPSKFKPLATALLGLPALAWPLASHAALPTGSLQFVTPNATVSATSPIDVFLRFTLDAASAPLVFSSNPLTGFAPADLPSQGTYIDPVTGASELRNFAAYSGAFLNTYISCSGSFIRDDCSPTASYSFEFWFNSTPGRPAIIGRDNANLAPGQSTEFLLGSFVPAAGGAAPGTYTFVQAGLTLSFFGQDATGNSLFSDGVTLGATCSTSSPGCEFNRTVVATPVPEPEPAALLLAGLATMAWLARRRATAQQLADA